MSYFARACAYYLRLTDKAAVMARCRAKYPRGVNLVLVPAPALGSVFAPDHCDADPGRIFLTYERLVAEAFVGGAPTEYAAVFDELRTRTASYNPDTTLLWLCVLTETDESEMHVFET